MKYILNRKSYIINTNESFLNPDGNDENKVEWEDTLVGSLLNRIYGSSKNKMQRGKINRIANLLDAAIARIFLNKSTEVSTENKEVVDSAIKDATLNAIDDILKDIENIDNLDKNELMLLADECELIYGEFYADDDIKIYLNEFKQYLLEAAKKYEITKKDNTNLIVNNKYNIIINGKTLPIIVDKVTDVDFYYYYENDNTKRLNAKLDGIVVSGNNIKMLDEPVIVDAKHTEMPSDDKIKEAEDMIKLYQEKKNTIDSEYLVKYADIIKKAEQAMKKNINDMSVKELDEIILFVRNIINSGGKLLENTNNTSNDNSNTNTSTKNNATNNLSKTRLSSNIDKVRELIKKRKANSKVTKREVQKIDNDVKEQAKNIINGSDLREVVNIMEKARQEILTNNYEALRKKQKRYYIPITGGLAIHKSSYDAWAKRVQNIATYYKDLLPEKFTKFLLDSLNYNSNINAFTNFPNVIKSYLGFDVDIDTNTKNTNLNINKTNAESGYLEATNGKKLIFIPTNNIKIEILKPFAINGKHDYKILLPIDIDRQSNIITFKYKTNNTEWLKNYYNNDDISIDNGKVPNLKNNNDVKLLYMELPKDTILKKDLIYTFYKALINDHAKLIDMPIDIKLNTIFAVYDKIRLTMNRVDITKTNPKIFDTKDFKKIYEHGDKPIKTTPIDIAEIRRQIDKIKTNTKKQGI